MEACKFTIPPFCVAVFFERRGVCFTSRELRVTFHSSLMDKLCLRSLFLMMWKLHGKDKVNYSITICTNKFRMQTLSVCAVRLLEQMNWCINTQEEGRTKRMKESSHHIKMLITGLILKKTIISVIWSLAPICHVCHGKIWVSTQRWS